MGKLTLEEYIRDNFYEYNMYRPFEFFSEYNDYFWVGSKIEIEKYFISKNEVMEYMEVRKNILNKYQKEIRRWQWLIRVFSLFFSITMLFLLYIIIESIGSLPLGSVNWILKFLIGIPLAFLSFFIPIISIVIPIYIYTKTSNYFDGIIGLIVQDKYKKKIDRNAIIEKYLSDVLWDLHKQKIVIYYKDKSNNWNFEY